MPISLYLLLISIFKTVLLFLFFFFFFWIKKLKLQEAKQFI